MLRYFSHNQHLKDIFDFPVAKVCIDAGFTCPNRDGSKGYGGCIYCNDKGSGAPYIKKDLSWIEQYENSRNLLLNRNPDTRFIIYFQAFSNTYAPVDYLENLYTSALALKDVVGISIGTRPDCVTSGILDMLRDLSKDTYLLLEYGLESIHNKTLELINRQHTYGDLLAAYGEAKNRNINVCLHIINGLPGESAADILETAKTVGQLEPDGIKIHSLYIETGTQLYNYYRKNPWHIFTEEEYVEIAARCIELMPQSTVIHRLIGEAIPDRLVVPEWSKNKQKVLNSINKKLCEWKSRQGAKFIPARSFKYKELGIEHV